MIVDCEIELRAGDGDEMKAQMSRLTFLGADVHCPED